MKLLASLALGTATFVAASFAFAAPALAGDDDVTVGVKLGPVCIGICIDGGHHDGGHHGRRRDAGYEDDFDGGFYAHREDYYHQTYDRRDADDYGDARDDGYAGYRRRYASRADDYGDEGYGERGRSDRGHSRRGKARHHDRDDD